MKKVSSLVNVFFAALLSVSSVALAQSPQLTEADKLFDFAESSQPTLFFPASETRQANEAGSDWFYRYFPGSDSYAAVNINGSGPYFAGNVYVLGPQFGDELLLVDTLSNLLIAVDAAASPAEQMANAFVSPGNGNCVERKFAAQNDTATFRTTIIENGSSVASNRTEFYETVSDTQTITVIDQGSTVDGVSIATSTRLTSYYESVNGMFFNTGSDSAITTRTDGSITAMQDINLTYTPALFIGPPGQICEGQEWFAAEVTQTLTTDADTAGSSPVVSQTLPTSVRVDSIGDVVSVGGGSFSTIKMTMTYPEGRTIHWVDIDFGVRVMSETYEGSSETPIAMEELTSFELPF